MRAIEEGEEPARRPGGEPARHAGEAEPVRRRSEAEGARRPGEESPSRLARDAELGRSGWIRRFTGAPPRLAEVRELYESLGLEVLLDPVSAEELPEGCGDCTLATSWFRVVYTRAATGRGAHGGSMSNAAGGAP